MWFLNCVINRLDNSLIWGGLGKVWTPDRYYSEGILQIEMIYPQFGLSQNRVAAIKTFEDYTLKHIRWLIPGKDTWSIDLVSLQAFMEYDPRITFPKGLDFPKINIDVKPDIEWEKDENSGIYSAKLYLHVFKNSIDHTSNIPTWIWDFIHPKIKAIAIERFSSGHYADSVEAAFKEINHVIKNRIRDITTQEFDGPALMRKAFSAKTPLLLLGDISTRSGIDIQQGYMDLFAGAMTGIRNPKAHENIQIDSLRAIHLIFLASLLMHKYDESTPSS